jgi:hypothetical protein
MKKKKGLLVLRLLFFFGVAAQSNFLSLFFCSDETPPNHLLFGLRDSNLFYFPTFLILLHQFIIIWNGILHPPIGQV